MLKKLRLKFVLINMTIVTMMLGIIFGSMYYLTGRSLKQESLRMMHSLNGKPLRQPQPDRDAGDMRLPCFSVMLDKNGEARDISGGFFDLSNIALLEEIVSKTEQAGRESGVLEEYNLRFLRVSTPMGTNLIFADMSSEQATLRNLMQTLLITGLLAFLAFLAISFLLARWAVKPVEQAWTQQKQFVADASHELKTPLTVILTDASLLQTEPCSEENRTQLTGGILAMAKQMRGLVEQLLELARMDSGSVQSLPENVSLSEITEEMSMIFEPVLFEKGLIFSYEIDPGLCIRGHAAQLRQLTEILLDNAGKYASPGGQVKLKLNRSAYRRCILEVSNEGEAIRSEDIKHLFERFYRADKARTLNHSYGLGLAIAKTIVESHRGRIRAESRDGINRFQVELPLLS